jgi:hypothetical protein
MVIGFTITHEEVVGIDAIGHPERLRQFDLAVFSN